MLAGLQRQLIYYPETAAEEQLLAHAAATGLAPWRDAQGALIGWRSPATEEQAGPRTAGPRKAGPRLLVFHGNAGHALYREYFAAGFRSLDQGWDIFLFEYPGYGARPGSPSSDTIKAAAEAAMQGLLAERPGPLFLLGESLGSGVASYLAGRHPDQVSGVLLVTPFTRLADVAAHHYPILPVRSLLSERYDSVEALSDYRGPVAFLVAGRDEVVPSELGLALHQGYRGPKWLRVVPGAGHNTLPYNPREDWWAEAAAFLSGAPR